ncbi:MAG: hypothetical protein H6774_03045 [Pseudomonadales bacterium]|nr:hypothetical protein [Pseudomonadales bacterium]
MVKKLKKKSNQREDTIELRVRNKLLYYMINGLGSFIQNLRQEKTIKNIGKKIYLMLKKNNIPFHWHEVITNYVVNPQKAKNPDHEYLTLKIGNHYIQSSSVDEEKIRKLKGNEFSIVIGGKVSKTEIKEFLDRHSELIYKLYDLLDLQETNYLGDPSFDEHFLTTLVKDKQNITLKEVFEFVGEDIDDSIDYSRTRGRIRNSKKLDIS